MPSAYEKAIADQAIYSIARVTAPENPAASLLSGVNGIDYMPNKSYDGRKNIADVVKEEKDPVQLYSNPITAMKDKDPEKAIYASLLNYEFMN